MAKDRFLKLIQQEACFEKSRANEAWKAAVNIDENDSRWQAVSGEDMHNAINDFAKIFGIELPPMQVRKQRLTHTEQQKILNAWRRNSRKYGKKRRKNKMGKITTGSEKQIAWAEKIHQELVDQIETQALKFESRKTKTEEDKKRATNMAQAYRKALYNYLNRSKPEEVAKREDARWWIDRRDHHATIIHKWAMENFEKIKEQD